MLEGAWVYFLAAAGGGALGAALGALQAFSCRPRRRIGEMYALLFVELGSTPGVDIIGDVGFGPAVGPHVAFGGGAAAIAFLASRDERDTAGTYYRAKAVTRGLGARPDALTVGAGFGIMGYLVSQASRGIGLPTDPVALGIVLSAILHRPLFG